MMILRRTFATVSMSQQLASLKQRALNGDFATHRLMEIASDGGVVVGAGGGGGKTASLLHPPGACSAFTRSGSQYPPLGLNLLKAVINDTSRVDVIEADGYGMSIHDTVTALRSHAPLAVGMTVTCGTLELVDAWSTVVKNMGLQPTPLIIVGGPAAAFEADTIFDQCANVDVVVKGDGEVTFPSIVDQLELQRQGTSTSSSSSSSSSDDDDDETLRSLSALPVVKVRGMPEMNDLKIAQLPSEEFEHLPFPDLSSSPVHKYCAPDASRLPMLTMITQRGCIAKCTFCNTPQKDGFKIRGWSNERIVEELKLLKNVHGIKEVSFVDDVFTNRRGGPRQLCELMVKEKLDLTWYCNARADQMSLKMAKAMRRAGCHQVFLGFESGCDVMLKSMNKGETVAQLEKGAALLQSEGINISVGFIVGYPGETQASVDRSIALCNRVKPDRVQFTRFTPIPGSDAARLHPETFGPAGFHCRTGEDQVERWIQQCYRECNYAPTV